MGCRALKGTSENDGEFSLMYDSTVGAPFGPIFWGNQDAADHFINWCVPADPRSFSPKELNDKHAEFQRLFLCQDCQGLRNDSCGWCSDFAEEYPLRADGKHYCLPLPLEECDQPKSRKCNHADADVCCGGGVDGKGKGVSCGCISCHGEVRVCEKEPEPPAGQLYLCPACENRRQEEKQRIALRRRGYRL